MMRGRPFRRLWPALLLWLPLAPAAAPAAPSPQQLAVAVKAAFIPKFARYVSWPSERPMRLCIIGQDPFGRLIDRAAASERIGQRQVTVHRMANADHASGCAIAFVDGDSRQSTAQMLAKLRAWPVLTVTDAELGSTRGMIHFAISGGKVGFHIDDAAAARSNLSISSRLLRLAISVKQR